MGSVPLETRAWNRAAQEKHAALTTCRGRRFTAIGAPSFDGARRRPTVVPAAVFQTLLSRAVPLPSIGEPVAAGLLTSTPGARAANSTGWSMRNARVQMQPTGAHGVGGCGLRALLPAVGPPVMFSTARSVALRGSRADAFVTLSPRSCRGLCRASVPVGIIGIPYSARASWSPVAGLCSHRCIVGPCRPQSRQRGTTRRICVPTLIGIFFGFGDAAALVLASCYLRLPSTAP